MNSILRQSHIKATDLRNSLRNYDSTNTTAVSIWAKSACADLEPGALVFIVEPVTLPFGLITFVRKEEEDSYRITDFAVVVRKEDGKAMAVSVTNNTYELRFLEALIEERARKAIIERKKFSFVAAKPIAPLALTKFQELERLSNLYAKGGARRNFMNTTPQEEPAIALMTACGVHLQFTSVNKQPIEIGSICFSLLSSEAKQHDSNRNQLRENFVPLPSDITQTKSINSVDVDLPGPHKGIDVLLDKSSEGQGKIGFNLLQSWGGADQSGNFQQGALLENIGTDLPKGQSMWQEVEEAAPTQPELGAIDAIEEISFTEDKKIEIAPDNGTVDEADAKIDDNGDDQTEYIPTTGENVYEHLSQAITDLLGAPSKTTSQSPTLTSPEPMIMPQTINDFSETTIDTSSTDFNQSISSEAKDNILEEPAFSDLQDDSLEVETGDPVAIFSSSEMVPSKLDDFQEPKVVMNEMASLMSKLESQVARAAKKLAARASEVEKRLTTNLDNLLNAINTEDKDGYAELVVRSDSLAKQFESLFDNLKSELAEKAASSREQIKSNLPDYQKKIGKSENEQQDNLVEEFKENKTQFNNLVDNQESELNKLIEKELDILNKRIVTIDQTLEDASVNLGVQLEDYFHGFKERVHDQVTALLKSSDHHLDNLNKDIDRLMAESIEQLKLSKTEFFDRLNRLVKITEIALSRQVRKAHTQAFLPKMKERKQIIEAMMQEMLLTFAEHSFSQAKAQSEGAEHSLILAREQLKELVEERLAKLDVVGRNQQTGLEEIFRSVADPLEKNTDAVVQLIKQAESEINECEAVCTKLAQSYNLDNDPKLTSLRQDVYSKVDSLKTQLKGALESTLDDDCQKLEEVTKNYHVKLNNKRTELAQQVRSVSDKGLQNIRQAIHDAFQTIQSEREKYME